MTIPIPPFNDVPPVPMQASQAVVVSGSDTTGIDAYRQGVELTRDIYFYEGSFKIWSGDLNHQPPQHEFGQLRVPVVDNIQFVEQNRFDPVSFVSQRMTQSMTASLQSPVAITEEGQSMDGVIEPLQIRPRIAFFSAEGPPLPPIHIPRGELAGGNTPPAGPSDRVLTVDRIKGKFAFFIDRASEIRTTTSSLALPDAPMIDTIDPQGFLSTPYMDAAFVNVLRMMSSSSDTYVPSGSFAMPSGFGYDTPAGTDSIAFGNLLYRPIIDTATIANQISGLQFRLQNFTFASPTVANCQATNTSSQTLTGDSHRIFNVTIRFRGEVEQKTYSGGTNDGAFFQIGGTPAADAWNVYSLQVSNPPGIYYLNRGSSGQFRIYGIDYTHTIPIAGNATLILAADAIGTQQITNNQDGAGGSPYSVPGITNPGQPYNGQFIQMDVVGIS